MGLSVKTIYARGTNNRNGIAPIDWPDTKRRIIAALGPLRVYEEFAALGVQFENSPNGRSKATCHAMDRPDERASAFVDCSTGIYCTQGGSGETLHLFDFALKYGNFGDWLARSATMPDWLTLIFSFARTAKAGSWKPSTTIAIMKETFPTRC